MVEVRKITDREMAEKGVSDWPVWEKEISRFPAGYDEEEWCYFIEGEVAVETGTGVFAIQPGDFVVFRKGLNCIWDIKKPVRKHYKFV